MTASWRNRRLAPLLGAAALLVAATRTNAACATTLVVEEFTGAKAKLVHDRVVKALRKSGHELSTKAETGAILSGKVTLKKSGWVLAVSVRSSTGAVLTEDELKGALLPRLLSRIDSDLGNVVDRAESASATNGSPASALPTEKQTPPSDEPESTKTDAREPARTDAPAPSSAAFAEGAAAVAKDTGESSTHGKERDERSPTPFSIAVGVRGFSRSFTYSQDVNANLRPYSLGLAPAGFTELEWYPGAHFVRGAGAHVGIVGDYSRSVATSTTLEGQASYTTTFQAFSVGARGRLPLGSHEVGLSARFGRQDFSVDAPDGGASIAGGATVSRSYIPAVRYAYLRPGIDLRLGFGAFGVGAHAGYRIVLDAGDIQGAAWFPRATVAAGDFGAFVSYAIGSGLEARLGGDLVRYAFDMHSKPADLRTNDVAGGAVDQYAMAYLAVAWRAPGL